MSGAEVKASARKGGREKISAARRVADGSDDGDFAVIEPFGEFPGGSGLFGHSGDEPTLSEGEEMRFPTKPVSVKSWKTPREVMLRRRRLKLEFHAKYYRVRSDYCTYCGEKMKDHRNGWDHVPPLSHAKVAMDRGQKLSLYRACFDCNRSMGTFAEACLKSRAFFMVSKRTGEHVRRVALRLDSGALTAICRCEACTGARVALGIERA